MVCTSYTVYKQPDRLVHDSDYKLPVSEEPFEGCMSATSIDFGQGGEGIGEGCMSSFTQKTSSLPSPNVYARAIVSVCVLVPGTSLGFTSSGRMIRV
jgi:hypothetical protein